MHPISIGISSGHGPAHEEYYTAWLKGIDPAVTCVDLSLAPPNDAVQLLNGCSALVLTSGPDIDPDLYEKPEEKALALKADRARDQFELALIQRARLINLPVFAISRGMQLLNVFLGGTLKIVTSPDGLEHNRDDELEHSITIAPDTLLHSLAGLTEATVNSAHHQSIDKLSWYLKPVAVAPDGVVEAFEWSDQTEKPFLLAVQWHPERLPKEHPMSGKLAEAFLGAAKAYIAHHRV
jgi:putative glutamine amidotransferase